MARLTFLRGIQGDSTTEQSLELPAGGRVPVAGDQVYLPALDGDHDEALTVWHVSLNFNPDEAVLAYVRVRP